VPPRSPIEFRFWSTVFAAVLWLQAVWLISAEIERPAIPYFPVGGPEVEAATMQRGPAAIAASVGWLRGDLWVDYAITATAKLASSLENGSDQRVSTDSNPDAAIVEAAAATAPSDARAWLLLAMMAGSGQNDGKSEARLKMSYYTSPFDERLFPLRVQIAAQLASVDDEDLRSFIDFEVTTAIQQKPELEPLIELAFRRGTETGRQLLANAAGKAYPIFLKRLRTLSGNK